MSSVVRFGSKETYSSCSVYELYKTMLDQGHAHNEAVRGHSPNGFNKWDQEFSENICYDGAPSVAFLRYDGVVSWSTNPVPPSDGIMFVRPHDDPFGYTTAPYQTVRERWYSVPMRQLPHDVRLHAIRQSFHELIRPHQTGGLALVVEDMSLHCDTTYSGGNIVSSQNLRMILSDEFFMENETDAIMVRMAIDRQEHQLATLMSNYSGTAYR